MNVDSSRDGALTGPDTESPVWAITAYFDPLASGSRLEAYRQFRRHLKVPLVTVELSHRDGFDLEPADADILISLRGGAVLWQKERLLNIALRALPKSCDTVAWLDCDVALTRADWYSAARRLLNEFRLVQPFSRLHYLDRSDAPASFVSRAGARSFESIAFQFARGTLPEDTFLNVGMSLRYRYAPGMAWVARRDLLDECGGLYDAEILGYSGKLMFAAACGRYDDVSKSAALNTAQCRHYRQWAERFHDRVRHRISYVSGDILHLWHGDVGTRRYIERRTGFERFAFEPESDIRQNPDGVWCWNTDKPAMHSYLRRYFESLNGR